MIWIGYAAAWISSAAVSCVGIYFTHSGWCALVMLLPACIKITTKGEKGEKDGEHKES